MPQPGGRAGAGGTRSAQAACTEPGLPASRGSGGPGAGADLRTRTPLPRASGTPGGSLSPTRVPGRCRCPHTLWASSDPGPASTASPSTDAGPGTSRWPVGTVSLPVGMVSVLVSSCRGGTAAPKGAAADPAANRCPSPHHGPQDGHDRATPLPAPALPRPGCPVGAGSPDPGRSGPVQLSPSHRRTALQHPGDPHPHLGTPRPSPAPTLRYSPDPQDQPREPQVPLPVGGSQSQSAPSQFPASSWEAAGLCHGSRSQQPPVVFSPGCGTQPAPWERRAGNSAAPDSPFWLGDSRQTSAAGCAAGPRHGAARDTVPGAGVGGLNGQAAARHPRTPGCGGTALPARAGS
ncbi:splicing factor 3B subunit 4-like [Aquila chrysaetos chrysaetos]|uniref:splicing factor 3B subunit 4-like n=1 Tax=Aquila chrysaetos chrysaetos TaxID=223781 RepID=UPI001B7D3754|nr:splicing factor 3B subunit 4-like [Aquila chrysaetos chrysaetos]